MAEERMGFFKRLVAGLNKTQAIISCLEWTVFFMDFQR